MSVPLSLDEIVIETSNVPAAGSFYAQVFVTDVADAGAKTSVALHGTGTLALQGRSAALLESASAGGVEGARGAQPEFRGLVFSYVLPQPSEVAQLVRRAVSAGARLLKPAKRILFGAFAGTFQAPDGSIWKISAPRKRDNGPMNNPPIPWETAVLLGVEDPKASKQFYLSMGMSLERDYGSSYIDFKPGSGASRLGLMQRTVLAKDAATDPEVRDRDTTMLRCRLTARSDVDSLIERARDAGAAVVREAGEHGSDGYSARFRDPDGALWQLGTAR